MLNDFHWSMLGYVQKYGFQAQDGALTQREVERVFQLDPAPPEAKNLNHYIAAALWEKDLDYFSFFLHHYEPGLNHRIHEFLSSEGAFGYDPERFLDIKLSCVEAMLQALVHYDPEREADFATFVFPLIRDAWLNFRKGEEALSIDTLSQYKNLRLAGHLGGASDAVKAFAEKRQCSPETAEKYLRDASLLRNRVSFYVSEDEDGKEAGEDVTCDNHWDYVDILWDGIQAEKVRNAFDELDYREQTLLEKRLAICMTCGCVRPWKNRASFEELAVQFEGSSASGAEKAYQKAVEHLIRDLVGDGTIRAARIQRKSASKSGKVCYLYQADFDGEWGEISFDLTEGTSQITTLAEWDTVKSNIYAKAVIRYILSHQSNDLPRCGIITMKRES